MMLHDSIPTTLTLTESTMFEGMFLDWIFAYIPAEKAPYMEMFACVNLVMMGSTMHAFTIFKKSKIFLLWRYFHHTRALDEAIFIGSWFILSLFHCSPSLSLLHDCILRRCYLLLS